MTGRGKRLPLLTVFKTRESRFIKNKQNLISQRASEMKPDFSLESQRPFSLLRENSGTLFFSVFPFLSFLSYSLASAVRQWPKNLMEGLISSIVQRHQTSVLISEEPFFSDAATSPSTCQKNKHAFAAKNHVERKVKCVCVKKRRDASRGTSDRARKCKVEETASLRKRVRHLRRVRCFCLEF